MVKRASLRFCNCKIKQYVTYFLLNPKPVRAEVNEAETVKGGEHVDAISRVKHVLLPVTDRNPYLSEGTRQVLFLSLLFYVIGHESSSCF